jgi:hypothetical protein
MLSNLKKEKSIEKYRVISAASVLGMAIPKKEKPNHIQDTRLSRFTN